MPVVGATNCASFYGIRTLCSLEEDASKEERWGTEGKERWTSSRRNYNGKVPQSTANTLKLHASETCRLAERSSKFPER